MSLLTKLKLSEMISLAFSAVALFFSALAFYFQFFYTSSEVLVHFNFRIRGNGYGTSEPYVDAVFINTGNRDAFIMSCSTAIMERNTNQNLWTSITGPKAPYDSREKPLAEVAPLPRVVRGGSTELVRCGGGGFTAAELFDSPNAYEALERNDSAIRKVLLGVFVTAFDSAGRRQDVTYHLWTEYLSNESTDSGFGENSIFWLFSDGQSALNKDWSNLRPVADAASRP